MPSYPPPEPTYPTQLQPDTLPFSLTWFDPGTSLANTFGTLSSLPPHSQEPHLQMIPTSLPPWAARPRSHPRVNRPHDSPCKHPLDQPNCSVSWARAQTRLPRLLTGAGQTPSV